MTFIYFVIHLTVILLHNKILVTTVFFFFFFFFFFFLACVVRGRGGVEVGGAETTATYVKT